MVSAKSPELPPGWTEHVKVSNGRKTKYYVNGEIDKKFYSKLSVLRHIESEAGSPSRDVPQQSNEDKKQSSETTVTPLATETSGSLEWLPHGWTMELKTKQSGKDYKCYINNATGKKFYSKVTVMRYLETEVGRPCQSTPHQIGQDNETSLATEVTPPHMGSMDGDKLELSQDQKELKGLSCTSMPRRTGLRNQSNKTSDQDESGGNTPISKSEDSLMPKGASMQKQTDLNKQPGIEVGTSMQKQTDLNKQPGIEPKMTELDRGTNPVKPEGGPNRKVLKLTKARVAIKRVTADGLPPGWIKELKIEKKAYGYRKDPFYTDPVSGYVFRSQKDALRYLQTGDINVCAIKPKKRKELGFFNEVASETLGNDEPDSNANNIESEGSRHSEMMKGMSCTFTEKQTDGSEQRNEKVTMDKLDGGTSDAKSVDTQNREKLKLKKGQVVIERLPADGLPPGWIKELKIEKRASGIRRDPFYTDPVSGYVFRSEKDVMRYLNTGDVNQCATKPRKREEFRFLSEGAFESSPPAADSEDLEHTTRRQLFGGKENGCKVSSGTSTENPDAGCGEINGLTSPSPKTEDSKKTQGNGVSRRNRTVPAPSGSDNSKKQTNSSNSKRKSELPLTRRSSKRLAGSKENESKPSPVNTDTVSVNEVVPARTPPSEMVLPNGSKRPSEGKQPVLEDQPLEQETKKEDPLFEQEAKKKDEEDAEMKLHPFGDSWSDPCLEFAIKTLTGTLPDVDNLETEFPFPQVSNTCTKVDSCLTLLDFSSPSSLQSNIPPPTSDVSAAKPYVPQFEGNPCFKSPGIDSLPSSSENAPPQPSLNTDTEHWSKLGS